MMLSRSSAPGRSGPCVLREAAVAGEHAGDLPGAVGAVVEHDADIVVANDSVGMAMLICNHERHNKLVRDAVVVGLLHARDGIGVSSALGPAFDHGFEGKLFALPAAVAIHGVVAAGDGGDLADLVFAHLLFELREIACA